ncbi:NAD-dependent epimerase/dehydratase family protein [Paenibacillus roseipurpureus]|uniref:NAD-dependent epimerase/dehydratase family protein n=1 Tax=Paenibacillus roseopurpureus TaxID=2918901 RepID=A0AA96LNR8_9BACL|nr:NAD-dependent epimerase/dehydratase family protein [Paenibacillus sp. MBLB1832]WNR44517.1 NAD-dependent epimerase/dehydratase family protein [Paenibacillus sp. MBLB1832]
MGKQVNVIFGTGPLGMAVMRELKRRGVERIRMVNRSGRLSEEAAVEVARGDASQLAETVELCKDAAVVYHCAHPGYTNWPTQFPGLTRGIMAGAAAAGAKLIYGDNLYMYGQVNQPLTENLPHLATGKKGLTRAQMAEELLLAHQSGKLRVAIGRASDFYGPGVKQSSLGDRVFGFALSGKPVDLLGNLDVPHTYTYIDDFARGLVTLGHEDRALGQVWHVPSAKTHTTREMLGLIFDELGSARKIRTSSRGMVTMIGLFHPMLRELKEVFYEFEQPFVVDHSKYLAAFGDQGTTPHDVAIRETVRWYRQAMGE